MADQQSILRLADTAREGAAETRVVTIELDGGSAGGLAKDGWVLGTQGDNWSLEVASGSSVTLPMPTRYGYDFLGWDANDDGAPDDGYAAGSIVSVTADLGLRALWQRQSMTVTFSLSAAERRTLSVPYQSILWSDEGSKPWEGASFGADGTATVDIAYQSEAYSGVEVTRHEFAEAPSAYWYSFVLTDGEGHALAFFAYGGTPAPASGSSFSHWKMTQGGEGYQVTQDKTVFVPQFRESSSYILNVHYRQEDGTTVAPSQTFAVGASEVADGEITQRFSVPSNEHYKVADGAISAYLTDGSEVSEGFSVTSNGDGSYTATVSVGQVFGNVEAADTRYLSIVVLYRAEDVHYQVEYYQQDVDRNGYTLEDTVQGEKRVAYGDRIAIAAQDYDGFLPATRSRLALADGVYLIEQDGGDIAWDAATKTFMVRIYYDRASYFVYPFLNSTEAAASPRRVTLGATVGSPMQDDPTRAGYTFGGWAFYRLSEEGELVPAKGVTADSQMPAHDLYAVAQWVPAEVEFRVVLWLEDADSSGYSNVYETTVDLAGVEAGDRLFVSTDTGELVVANADDRGQSFVSSDLLDQYVQNAYQDKGSFSADQFAQFFSYNEQRTRTSPGNITLAEQAGATVSGGQLGNSFEVLADADGTTSINVYYARNLYSVDIVLAQRSGSSWRVANRTDGGLDASKVDWANYGDDIEGFSNSALTSDQQTGQDGWQNGKVTTYRLAGADGTPVDRSPIGRCGEKTINGSAYLVYQITAKFEAPIEEFWPTNSRVQTTEGQAIQYISVGPDAQSYYRQVATSGTAQHNILNIYGTMSEDILLCERDGAYSAVPTDESGTAVTHLLVSYWNSGATQYTYYFLRELVDAEAPEGAVDFDVDAAAGYEPGTVVRRGDRYYLYDTSDAGMQVQMSTAGKDGQNQPSLPGFENAEKRYAGDRNDIYFFYDRERYDVVLHNGSTLYALPQGAWSYEVDGRTLAECGWEVASDGGVTIRSGGSLAHLGDDGFIDYLTSAERGEDALESPDVTTGESRRYFSGWYLNQKLSVEADWAAGSDLLDASGNVNLYASWSTPRYTTTYALNGGTWQDAGDSEVSYTLVVAELPWTADDPTNTTSVFFAFPHQTSDASARLAWYAQTEKDDRLHIDTMYEVTGGVDEVMHWNGDVGHWVLDEGLSVEALVDKSQESDFSSLTGRYFCYMADGGADASTSHERYVSVNRYLGDSLAEPAEPVRNGYRFAGWYEFDDESRFDPASPDSAATERRPLADELVGTDLSVGSYDEGYVYVDQVGDAYLVHRDAGGELFYYPAQTGYRLSFEYGASVVTATRMAYAAWESEGDAELTVRHLVEKSAVDDGGVTFPDYGLALAETVTLRVGGVATEYYVLSEQSQHVSNGSTVRAGALDRLADGESHVWLPGRSVIPVSVTEATQTVTVAQDGTVELAGDTGSYRVDDGSGGFGYFAYFVYERTDSITYNVYAINLSLAVAEGALPTFDDTFDREDPPATDASYVLSAERRTYELTADVEPTVNVSAPELAGWSVYRDTRQSLALAADESSNNVYFYYVSGDASARYSITYHLMHDGSYETGWTAEFENVPAANGETLSRDQLERFYDTLVSSAYLADEREGSVAGSNDAQLFERYEDMTVTLSRGGDQKTFTVGGAGGGTLGRDEALAFDDGSVYDGHNPTNELIVLGNGTHVDVYLKLAQITVNKVDWADTPLAGCTFTLERLVPRDDVTGAGETILYDADGDGTPEQYVVDASFSPVTATSDEHGAADFMDLAADEPRVYRLTETACPEGYAPLREPVCLAAYQTDADGNPVYHVTYTVRNNGVTGLPVAGSLGGVYVPLLAGGAFAAAAVVLVAAGRGGRADKRNGN